MAGTVRSKGRAEVHRVVWPRGRRVVEQARLADRLSTLDGKTIAFLWDEMFRGDEIFPIIQAELARRFPGARFVPWNAFGSIYGGAERQTIEALPARLRDRQVDAVVSAVGC